MLVHSFPFSIKNELLMPVPRALCRRQMVCPMLIVLIWLHSKALARSAPQPFVWCGLTGLSASLMSFVRLLLLHNMEPYYRFDSVCTVLNPQFTWFGPLIQITQRYQVISAILTTERSWLHSSIKSSHSTKNTQLLHFFFFLFFLFLNVRLISWIF